jgi:hypothetical protein
MKVNRATAPFPKKPNGYLREGLNHQRDCLEENACLLIGPSDGSLEKTFTTPLPARDVCLLCMP